MNIQAILVANITGFCLLVILLITRYITRRRWNRAEQIFLHITILPLLSCIVEPVTFLVDGQPGLVCHYVNLLGNTYLYGANLAGSYLWCIYVDLKLYDDKSRIHKYRYYKSFVIFLGATLFGNLWGGYYFTVDAQNVYHRQPLILLFYVLCMMCMLTSVVILLLFKSRHSGAKFFPLWYFMVPVLVGTVLQGTFYGISLAWLGVAVGLVAMQMGLQNEQSYQDGLTGLYNRLYLEHTLWVMTREYRKNYYGIMIDINYFKKINDTYGHSMGDEALKDLASIMDLNIPPSATAFRMAGDEFVILIKTEKEEEIQKTMENLNKAVNSFNALQRRPYQLSLSMGYAMYNRKTDTDDTFLKKMDEAMYLEKQRAHAGR